MSYHSLLNRSCTIEVNTPTKEATTREQVDSWATHVSGVRCRLDQAGGPGEVRVPNDLYSKVSHVLFVHYRTDLDEFNYRILIEGTYYNIMRINNAGGQNHHTEILLELVKAGQ